MIGTKPKNVEAYIASFPEEVQKVLEEIRAAIKKAAPEAEEKISYAMPTYVLHGNLVHFAAHKNHIGFYPVPSGIEAFKKELSGYKATKGSVHFPLDKPVPLQLIEKIVKFRVEENLRNAEKKKSLRTCKKGHKYYKSSDCPTCPECEKEKKPKDGFLALVSAPARRALENNGIHTLHQLSKYHETEILTFHGMGKSSIPKLRKALTDEGFDFRK